MIYRVEVWTAGSGPDKRAIDHNVAASARDAGVPVDGASTTRVFLIETDEALARVQAVALPLLVDPIVEGGRVVDVAEPSPGLVEVHLKPGVMDPVAASTEMALRGAGLTVTGVRTGRAHRFWPAPAEAALRELGGRVLGNSVIESVHLQPFLPAAFPAAPSAPFELREVPLRGLDDAALARLSRAGHLFLSVEEMRAIQRWYDAAGRDPTDIELETFAQTWSEHCVHKTLKSRVEVVDEAGQPLRSYGNLIKETIFASTMQLMAQGKSDFCLSVFKDNAGVIAFDESDAVCIKVETHNRPSAIDPYGGAATGVGGCIRDVIGTGLGARPIANTDVFCVGLGIGYSGLGIGESASTPTPNTQHLPPGVLHPKRVLTQVVAGVRDYGNRMGIPTVNGAVYFDDNYIANPLVFCGCIGILPRTRIHKAAQPGDAIIVIGGRTGRDGIHGATFSSAELTSTHADEFSHAVQIGNAITEKQMLDVVLQAAERGLYTAITDCGAGGLSSAVGEMGEQLGAEVHLDRVPLKYPGLRYDEIWISEAQERMVLSVPQPRVAELLALAAGEDVEATVLGHFGTDHRELRLTYNGTRVGTLSMSLLHEGTPMPLRRAVVRQYPIPSPQGWWQHCLATHSSPLATLPSLLSHPNIASKRFIIRQYDHEVQGMSVVKPLVGPHQRGPSDGAVLRPKPASPRGIAIGSGLAPWIADPYEMALAAIDEAVRNVVAVGGDPNHTAILDNFCWPGTDDPAAMGDLVRTAEACRDAALAYRIPFISGKDSLHNQYTDKSTGKVTRIPNTLLITALAIVPDVARCVTMDLKRPGNGLYLVRSAPALPARIATHRRVAAWIAAGQVAACHDVSDGGWLTAVAEMAIGAGLGVDLAHTDADAAFDECIGAYVIETPAPPDGATRIGTIIADAHLRSGGEAIAIDDLARAWLGGLDW